MGRTLLALGLVLATASVAGATSGGTSGMASAGCAGCHSDSGATASITVPSQVSPGQVVQVTVSVTAPFAGGGGFDAHVSAGTIAAGTGSQVRNGDATHSDIGVRTWTFTWTAPQTPGSVTIHVAAVATDSNGENSGDAPALAQAVVTVGGVAPADADGDGTPDSSDCAPNDASVHPGAAENCANGIDDDCDGAPDATDPACATSVAQAGDVAPRHAPDGAVNIGDVVLVLRFAVDLETPSGSELDAADLAPGSVTDPASQPPTFTPVGNRDIDIGDAVVLLRASVGLVRFGPAPDPCGHALPVASAGADQRVVRGALVTLDGRASSEAEEWAWTMTARPAGSSAALAGSATSRPTFVPDVVGNYTATLLVTNCRGTSAADTVTVTASSLMLVAAADTSNYDNAGHGAGQRDLSGRLQYTANLGATDVRLQGDGTRADGPVTYLWEQVKGLPVTLSNPAAANTTFTAPRLADILDELGTNRWGVLPIAYIDLELGFRLTASTASATSSTILHVYLEDGGYDIQPRSAILRTGRGARVYLQGARTETDGDVITGWTWTVTGPAGNPSPVLRDATTRTPSFVPNAEGVYEVGWRTASVAGAGTPTDSGSFMVTSASYVGSSAMAGSHSRPGCAGCHDGSVQPDRVTSFLGTGHAGQQLTRIIGPSMASYFKKSRASIAALDPSLNPPAYELANPTYCLRCHTGWNTNPSATNGGLDDLLVSAGFEVPPTGLTWVEVETGWPAIANMAGEQCESCHGPGSQHEGNLAGSAMGSSLGADVCSQCHSEQPAGWRNSKHARMVTRDSAYGSGSCVRCHSAQGFIRQVEGTPLNTPAIVSPEVATCAACHDPHSAEHDMQLRIVGDAVLASGLVVDAGAGASCMTCHQGRYGDSEAQARASSRSAHHNVQGPMFVGTGSCVNFSSGAFTFTEGSFHATSGFVMRLFTHDASDSDRNDTCVTCHMAPGPREGEPGYEEIGGHSWNVSERMEAGTWTDSTADGPATAVSQTSLVQVPGASLLSLPEDAELVVLTGSLAGSYEITGVKDATTLVVGTQWSSTQTITDWRIDEMEEVQNLNACSKCHSTLTDFNRLSRADYDGDGDVEGVQDEVQGLLDVLASKIVAVDAVDVGGARTVRPVEWTDGGLLGLSNTLTNTSNDVLYAVYNWNLVHHDGSMGVHNTAYAVQMLQKTYTALSKANPTVDDPRTPGNDANKSFDQAYPAATLR